jgi:glycosyltransferase involved in cell wall biosynthesis
MKKKVNKLSLIVPVFNEEDSIGFFYKKINNLFKKHLAILLEIIFVNDGSSDSTLDKLLALQNYDKRVVVIDLSRNFGKEAAITAGLEFATGNILIPIDVDLQDPPELIIDMIRKWEKGFDVVVAKRVDRSSDFWFKRHSSKLFYRLFNKISETKIPDDVGDFRLMSRSVVEAIKKLPESTRFMKGIFNWVGFKIGFIEYARPARSVGNSKFSSWKLLNFAVDGLTSFSIVPLQVCSYLGLVISLISFLFGCYIFFKTIIFGVSVKGYSSIVFIISFLGGIQLLALGIIGEYIGRIYIESKRRPIFIIREIYK